VRISKAAFVDATGSVASCTSTGEQHERVLAPFRVHLAGAVLAAEHAGRGDEDGVVAVVGDDLVQVLGPKRLRVVVEDLLGASRRCHLASPFGHGCRQPSSPISADASAVDNRDAGDVATIDDAL
jgi:hypothetical protein